MTRQGVPHKQRFKWKTKHVCTRHVSVTDNFNILPFFPPCDQWVWSYLCDCRLSNERRMSGRVPTAPRKVGRQEPVNKAHTPGNSQSSTCEAWQVCSTADRREIPIKTLCVDHPSLPHHPLSTPQLYFASGLPARMWCHLHINEQSNKYMNCNCLCISIVHFSSWYYYFFSVTTSYPAEDEGIIQGYTMFGS